VQAPPSLSHTPQPSAAAVTAPPRELLLVGAHGGAGVTTLAVLMRVVLAAGEGGRDGVPSPAWQVYDMPPRLPPHPSGRPLVVVSRCTVSAAGRAVKAVTALTSWQVPVTALAVIADGAGGEPAEATARLSLLAGRAGPVVRIPFAARLRLVDDPAQVRLPKRTARALHRLAEVILADGARRC
jgi:hypothetical protein